VVPAFVSRIEWMATMFPAELLQALLDDGRAAGLSAALCDGERLVAAMALTAQLDPTCLIHGDTHSGNAYLDGDDRACWLAWQIAQWGHWSVDVAYHLGIVLTVDVRRRHEADLLHHYLDELGRNGIDAPTFDDAWASYPLGFTWGFLLWVITSISSREVVLIHLPRLGAALEDHDSWGRLGVV
jgi:aminoglycoside phosphotransferase (APT) family kinase protein